RSTTHRSLLVRSTAVMELLLLLLMVLGGAPAGECLELEAVKGGCLKVTLKPGDHIKTDPRCIVSRSTGLALRPPALPKSSGIVNGLRRRMRRANGRQEEPRDHPLQRLSNTMASNETECLLSPPFPGDIALLSVSGGVESEGQNKRKISTPDHRRRPNADSRRDMNSVSSAAKKREGGDGRGGRNHASSESDNSERPRTLVVLTQAIVAVGPEVIVKPLSSADARGRTRGTLSARKRGSGIESMGALSVCEGQGPVAVAGCGKLKKVRLSPGQKMAVDSSRAVGWTSGVMCFADAGGRASRSRSKDSSGGTNPSAVTTFVGAGTVYVQTHSLAGLRRLLLPRQGMGVSFPAGVPSGFLGAGGTRTGGSSSHTARRGAVVGLSLKRGLAKRAKAAAKKVALGLAFFALYLVVYSLATALLLEGRDGIIKAPRHAVQVVRSLVKVARRVALVLVRLVRDELWRDGEGETGRGAQPPQETPLAR
ncbi:unnamed protein product, partial [Hapterophycus canaliculatus]